MPGLPYEDGTSSSHKNDELVVDKDQFKDEISIISCGTTKGPIKMKLIKKWSPVGYERAVTLFEKGYYDFTHFFRTVPHFLVQFGISYTPRETLKKFADSTIEDDPQLTPRIEFDEGTISYAGSGKNSRNSQLFISYGKIQSLGTQLWETPIGTVIEGMEHVRDFYGGYGDMPPWGKGPEQQKIRNRGKKYMKDNFPLIDSFLSCQVERIIESKIRFVATDQGEDKGIKTKSDFSNQRLRGLGAVKKEIKTHDLKPSTSTSAYSILMFLFIMIFVLTSFMRKRRKEAKNN